VAHIAGESCLSRKTRNGITYAKVWKKIENQGHSQSRSHSALPHTWDHSPRSAVSMQPSSPKRSGAWQMDCITHRHSLVSDSHRSAALELSSFCACHAMNGSLE
jgi:hypothetical protein